MSASSSAEGVFRPADTPLLASCQSSPGSCDELRDTSGRVRPRWQGVLGAFATMGADATQAAQAKAQRLTVANDVTFAVMSDPEASAQWRPDLFPLPIEPHEWSGIERGVHELSDHIAERFFSHSSPTSVGGAGSGGS